jgi:hypothetical protein
MKRIGLLAVCCIALVVLAQTPVKEPQFADVFESITATGDPVPLERETAALRSGGGGFIVASGKAAYEIPGEKSTVRFHAGQLPDFVVRSAFPQTNTDPASMYVLRRLDIKKKRREIAFSTTHITPFGGHSTTNLNANQIPIAFARYGNSSYRITVTSLAPGEYALSRIYGQQVFCFGVD